MFSDKVDFHLNVSGQSYTETLSKKNVIILDKLRIKPQNKFEHIVTSSLSVDFKVTDLNMDRLSKLQQDLNEKFEQTNNRVSNYLGDLHLWCSQLLATDYDAYLL